MSIKTILTNPGIINRLEQDINDYLSPFGYSLERLRDSAVEDDDNCKAASNNSVSRAVLTTPHFPYSYTTTTNNAISSEQHEVAATNLSSTTTSYPICTLHLHIHNESLFPTIGPLLRTYLRLSPCHISPIHLRAIIHCNHFTIDPLTKYDKMNMQQKRELLQKQEEACARMMLRNIHLVIRNSMGSALCIELIVVLPCYWKRKVVEDNTNWNSSGNDEGSGSNEGSSSAPDSRTKVPISVESVKQAMQNNNDANYPTVQLQVEEQSSENMVDKDCRIGGNCNNTLHLHIETRMCTVRHQPLLFRWLHQLQYDSMLLNNDESAVCEMPNQVQPSSQQAIPLIVACIEKVANLHRILMICYDCDKNRGDDDSEPLLLTKVVVILPNTSTDQAVKILREFNDAVDNFHKVILGQGGNDICYGQRYRPTFVYEEDAAEQICTIIEQHKSTQSSSQSSIIGIDLHPDAFTLNGDYITNRNSSAMVKLRHADAIVFGYESTGIPDTISDILLNSWIQIPNRSSINVVAAITIVLDALMGNK